MKTYKQFITEKTGEELAKKYLAKEYGGWPKLEKVLKSKSGKGTGIDVENAIEGIHWAPGDENKLRDWINKTYGWKI